VPAWSRDGKWLYYSSNRSGVINTWKIPAGGGAEQQVTRNGGIYAAESYDGKYIYYSRGPIDTTLWRVPAGGGAEEPVAGAPQPFGCSHWAVGPEGLYIITRDADLSFYNFADHRSTTIIHRPGMLSDWSITVSPDGREVAWAQIDWSAADLMLVENFH
jgi:WD40-like Beta Propeller Repeat